MSLNLNCAGFSDKKGREPSVPPQGLKTHPVKLNRDYIKSLAEKVGKEGKLVLEVHDVRLEKEGIGRDE